MATRALLSTCFAVPFKGGYLKFLGGRFYGVSHLAAYFAPLCSLPGFVFYPLAVLIEQI